MRLRHWSRYAFSLVCYYSGLVSLSRWLRQRAGMPRVVILAYHSFSDTYDYLSLSTPPTLFLRQMEYMRSHFRSRTLGGLVSTMQRHEGIVEDTFVVTVDDGYADNYEPLMYAARELGVVSSVYVTTNYLDQRRPTTVMALILAVHHATVDLLELYEAKLGVLSIRTHAEKDAAIKIIDNALKPLPIDQQRYLLDLVAQRCGAKDLVTQLGKSAMLTWEQAREMLDAGIEIGAHTRSHPVLSLMHPEAVAAEISGSMRRVRDKIRCNAVTFAYPYGSENEVSLQVVEVCRRSGIAAAVLLVPGDVLTADRYALPRVMVANDLSTTPWGSFSKAMWACEMEGLVSAVRWLASPESRQREILVKAGLSLTPVAEVSLAVLSRLALIALLDADILEFIGELAFLG